MNALFQIKDNGRQAFVEIEVKLCHRYEGEPATHSHGACSETIYLGHVIVDTRSEDEGGLAVGRAVECRTYWYGDSIYHDSVVAIPIRRHSRKARKYPVPRRNRVS